MTDIADSALRRISRDLRMALPNSVRVTTSGGVSYLELLLLRTGGRYRADTGSSGGTACPADGSSDPNMLFVGASDSCFKTLGTVQNFSSIAVGDFLVVYNLQPGTTNADAYETGPNTGGNKAKILALPTDETTQARITFDPATFTYESPDQRFYIIEGPVTYACNPTAGTLTRYWGYSITSGQPTPPGGSSALVASNVSTCSFSYDPNVVAQSQGLVTLSLGLSSTDLKGASEPVKLYYTVHVSNVP
jgi:MSHA biogenesis protein MshO